MAVSVRKSSNFEGNHQIVIVSVRKSSNFEGNHRILCGLGVGVDGGEGGGWVCWGKIRATVRIRLKVRLRVRVAVPHITLA